METHQSIQIKPTRINSEKYHESKKAHLLISFRWNKCIIFLTTVSSIHNANKKIVNALENKSCKAKSITIKENNVIYVQQKNKELGYVGFPTRIDDKLIKNFINKDFVPIIAPMGIDEKMQAYNINADTAAGALAVSLKSRRLLLMTDVEGVLDENEKLISEIKSTQAEKLIYEQTIHGGMIPKIRTCINAVNNNVRGVVIIDGRRPHSILFELFSDKGSGTLIRKWKHFNRLNIGYST